MKLMQQLANALSEGAKGAATDDAKLSALTKSCVAHLKSVFKDKLMDTPMAMITQHVRSCVDDKTGTSLSKDELESLTSKVVAGLKSHLHEGEQVEEASNLTDDKVDDAEDKKEEQIKFDNPVDTAVHAAIHKNFEVDKEKHEGKEGGKYTVRVDGKSVKIEFGAGKFSVSSTDDGADNQVKSVKDKLDAAAKKVKKDVKESATTPFTLSTNFFLESLHAIASPRKFISEGVSVLGKPVDVSTIEVQGVDPKDRPDFADAYASYAEFTDGTALSDDELDVLTREHGNIINDKAHGCCREGDEGVDDEGGDELTEAKRGRPRKNPLPDPNAAPKKRGRPRKNADDGTDDKEDDKPADKKSDSGDEDGKKVSDKELAKSMENDGDEDDDDAKRADAAAKEPKKKIADTSVTGDQLKTAYEKLSKQIQSAIDSSDAKSAMELSKELRATFKDITTEEVRYATTIWKAENK